MCKGDEFIFIFFAHIVKTFHIVLYNILMILKSLIYMQEMFI